MAARSRVVLVACPDYERSRVREAVERGLSLLGPGAFESDECGDGRLLLKPNLLRPAVAEKGVTTHPAVFAAVADALTARGCSLAYGDSPNGVFSPLAAARACGVQAEAEARGIPLADFENGDGVSYPRGSLDRRFTVARAALAAAGRIVNLPRLKTHALTTMTGALKNTFGIIPGGLKARYHVTHPDVESFSRMIVDLNGAVPTRLVVMDAITVMEGNGPANGRLRAVGVLIITTDPVAADSVGCRIMGIDPLSVPLLRMAEEEGIGRARPDAIDQVGEDMERFVCADLDVRVRPLVQNAPRLIMRIAKDLIASKPTIDAAVCNGCGQCVDACPTEPKSIRQDGASERSVPRYLYSTCIRCYCCQETCPTGAISIRRAPLAGLFERR